MAPRKPTSKEIAIRERNRRNAQKSTGPRTRAGKRRSALNALTHGLRAESPRDAADMEDRERRAEVLMVTFDPEDDFETALVHRMASAFQRLERADHLESQALDSAIVVSKPTTGRILTNQRQIQASFGAINRYRATAQRDLFNAYRMLAVHRDRPDADVAAIAEMPNEA